MDVEPGTRISNMIYSGITIDLPDLAQGSDSIDFEFSLELLGSQNMSFVPLGSSTEVQLLSNWESPSFNGNFLPDHRELTDQGFEASWKILKLNRNSPQSWV